MGSTGLDAVSQVKKNSMKIEKTTPATRHVTIINQPIKNTPTASVSTTKHTAITPAITTPRKSKISTALSWVKPKAHTAKVLAGKAGHGAYQVATSPQAHKFYEGTGRGLKKAGGYAGKGISFAGHQLGENYKRGTSGGKTNYYQTQGSYERTGYRNEKRRPLFDYPSVFDYSPTGSHGQSIYEIGMSNKKPKTSEKKKHKRRKK